MIHEKEKGINMDETKSTSDNLQLEQSKKVEVEQKARELLKRETTIDISYENIIKKGLTGFMQAYLVVTVDDKTMTTKAKGEVVLNLAKSDLLRDQIINKFFF